MDPKTIGFHTLRARNARYFAGTNFSPCRRYVSGVLLRVSDRGLDASFQAVHQLNVRVPREVRQRLAEITGQVGYPADLCEAARYAAELQIVNIERLLHDAGIDAMNLVAIGQMGCDLWSHSESLGRTVMPLGCPQQLAEATGVSVIDRFHERDLAAGGTGGPLESLLWWLLLTEAKDSNSERPQVVVVLDETLEMYHMPPRRRGRGAPSIAWLGLGAGYGLLDQIASDGRTSSDAHLAELSEILQGQEIQSAWAPPTAVTRQMREEVHAVWNSTERGPTFADCERAAFPIWIARVREALENLLPQQPQSSRIMVLGRGGRREPFVASLTEAIDGISVVAEPKLGWIAGAPQAALAAISATLHVDQICGNLPELTGAKSARILGSISPGAPANWRNLLEQMQSGLQQRMPLRSAV